METKAARPVQENTYVIVLCHATRDVNCTILQRILRRYTIEVMEIGRRLKQLRKTRRLGQGELEDRTGLLRCYTGRVENGHTIPSVEIALGISLSAFLSKAPDPPSEEWPTVPDQSDWGDTPKERFQNRRLVATLATVKNKDRQLLVALARSLAMKDCKRRNPASARALL